MKQLTIRKATLNDLEVLLEFEQNIVKAERPFDATLQDGVIHYYDLAQMIAASNVEVLVAELDSEIVGSGYVRIDDSKIYLKHQKHGYLGFMYVKPDHRGKGINNQIIEALKQWCLAQNISELRLDVYSNNILAIKAYEKAGFTKLLVEMRMGIS